ncbi:MAG: aspartate carbamoyltransferase [Candidatus Melainabacteria bacterium]|nr:MAG: aspartate carbamoyltransferase [Candidatus Melainabacteria bacterium]
MEATASSQSANSSPQLPSPNSWSGRRHLIDTKDLTLAEVGYLINQAKKYKKDLLARTPPHSALSGRILANLFYENSTRTRLSFELAGRHLGMTVLNLDMAVSSAKKGESPEDTARTLGALGINAIVQRHSGSGSAQRLADAVSDQISVVNAGDGINAHPTQALLDLFTMLEYKSDLKGIKIAIIGDIKHSRVARSNLWLLQKLGVHVHFAGPASLMPDDLASWGAQAHESVDEAIKGADFVMALRIQLERQETGLIPSMEEYARLYRIDHKRLAAANPGVRVMHPGPINRGVEITDAIADDPELSLIERQVANGVPVRMSVLSALCKLPQKNEL